MSSQQVPEIKSSFPTITITTTTTTTILTGVSDVVVLIVGGLFSSQQVPETKPGQLAGPAVVHQAVGTPEGPVHPHLGAVDEVQALRTEIKWKLPTADCWEPEKGGALQLNSADVKRSAALLEVEQCGLTLPCQLTPEYLQKLIHRMTRKRTVHVTCPAIYLEW